MRRPATLVLVLALSGCAPMPVTVATLAADGFSYLVSGKSVTDHAISAVARRDCAVWRAAKGDPVCHAFAEGEGPTELAEVAPPGDDATAAEERGRIRWTDPDSPAETQTAAVAAPKRPPEGPARFVVLGSYTKRANADRAVVDGRTFAPVITPVRVDGRRFYRVVSGPYAPDRIGAVTERLTALGFRDAWSVSLCRGTFRAPPCTDDGARLHIAAAR